ncbi:hypothetical protein QX776_08655 [Alteromonadaceae bacterium BrNp21-10]|nr:hypothetical protein [Alteromonadaceae bacterium BrNp21-10]
MDTPETKSKLPLHIRVLLGIAGLPSIVLAYMLIVTFMSEGGNGISAFEVIYSAVGVFALYVAITGKRPF